MKYFYVTWKLNFDGKEIKREVALTFGYLTHTHIYNINVLIFMVIYPKLYNLIKP